MSDLPVAVFVTLTIMVILSFVIAVIARIVRKKTTAEEEDENTERVLNENAERDRRNKELCEAFEHGRLSSQHAMPVESCPY